MNRMDRRTYTTPTTKTKTKKTKWPGRFERPMSVAFHMTKNLRGELAAGCRRRRRNKREKTRETEHSSITLLYYQNSPTAKAHPARLHNMYIRELHKLVFIDTHTKPCRLSKGDCRLHSKPEYNVSLPYQQCKKSKSMSRELSTSAARNFGSTTRNIEDLARRGKWR